MAMKKSRFCRRRGGGRGDLAIGGSAGAQRGSGALARPRVRDTGPGCDPTTPFAHGHVGVTNTVARLDYLYGEAPWLRYHRDGGEFVAELRVPVSAS